MPNYIIDKDYRLLYFDPDTKKRFPDIAVKEVCYRVFNKTDSPCRGCRCFQSNEEKKTKYYNRTVDGEVLAAFTPLNGEEEHEAWLITVEEDMFNQSENFEDTENIDEIDLLTGLYRYNTFKRRAIAMLQSNPLKKWAMAALDIKHFKLFNLQYGDEPGDRLLSEISSYLNTMQQNEKGKFEVGYWGEDDFYMVLPDDESFIQRIQREITHLIEKYDTKNSFPPCIGMYHLVSHTSFRSMCDRAQLASNVAKQRVHDKIVHFEEGMLKELEQRHDLNNSIHKALLHREFAVYMQPKCNMRTGKIIGMEALARWKREDGTLVSPSEFIPYMEETGLITDLDLYIWEEVCRELRSIRNEMEECMLPVSVNVSIADIYAINVPEVLQSLIEQYEIEPRYLEVEITESVYAKETNTIRDTVEKLMKAGFTVLMDDFGSGYSSLNALKDIKVDILKIDMRFLHIDEEHSEHGIDILRSVVQLANTMQLPMIVEGVETKAQVEMLLDLGCLYGQGYYYYRPMPVSEMKDLIVQKGKIDVDDVLK